MFLALLLSLLGTFVTNRAIPTRLAFATASRPLYMMRVDLAYDQARLAVEQRVTVPNRTGQPLDVLVFHVTPAHYGAFMLKSAMVDGRPTTPRRTGTVLELALPGPLSPGESTTVALDYTIQLPRPGTLRFGASQDVIALGTWYPILAVWGAPVGENDWDRSQYTEIGDALFAEVADYDVTLTTDRPVTVAFGGDLVSRNGNQWRLRAERFREFGLAISHRYETRSAEVLGENGGENGGITLVTHYLPEHRAAAAEFLATGLPLVRWGNAALGRLPHTRITIAETGSADPYGVGQEYPGLVFVGSVAMQGGAGRGGYLSYLVAHELVHQWFYGLVGSNQIEEPWVDEAFATYLSYRFFADEFPGLFPALWSGVLARYQAERGLLGDRPVNSSVRDFASEADYFAVVYRRGTLFLDELRTALSDAVFRELLRTFVARYRDEIPRGTDFLDLAQAQTSADLSPLFRRYFTYGKYDPVRLDHAIPNGWFFKQANGRGGAGDLGYQVTDDDGVRFWSEFRRLGGVAGLGYPASRRFEWDGFTVQVFQKAILQWRPEAGQAYFVNVLDRLSAAGRDDWLYAYRQTPRPLDTSPDSGLRWDAVIRRHLALLDRFPAIREKYLANPNWLDHYGLPVSAGDFDGVSVVRVQRAVFQQWKVAVPWARAGEVTIANGGDLAKEAELLPTAGLAPEPAR
ncbi:MAG: M1 family metallopeptidase [Chloroflexi bacterium]|nr:M1 family metallopeptidase [Chloroflexota bacterium]